MNKAQPIKNEDELKKFKGYYREVEPNVRNYLMIVMGLNTALRISDILNLKWSDVYDFELDKYKQHIHIIEKKTGKDTQIYMNSVIKEALKLYALSQHVEFERDKYLFCSRGKNTPISRVQAHRIIKKITNHYKMDENISCHSLRKTFGYFARKRGTSPSLLVVLFNHSSYEITKRYLGIDQDDKDEVYKNIKL